MQDDELTRQLKRWGSAFMRPERDIEEREPVHHPLARAREFAPGTRERAMRRLIGRDGSSRRRLMALRAATRSDEPERMQLAPTWSCDPVSCKETRAKGPRRVDDDPVVEVPDDLRWIARALEDMRDWSPIRVLVVETEYQRTGSKSRKAGLVAAKYRGRFTVNMYKIELRRALDYLQGRMPL